MAKPTRIKIEPDKVFQKLCGTAINRVDALSNSVNTITDTESDEITTIDLVDSRRSPSADDPTTIGSRGRMHGASTVSIPAKIEIIRNIILF